MVSPSPPRSLASSSRSSSRRRRGPRRFVRSYSLSGSTRRGALPDQHQGRTARRGRAIHPRGRRSRRPARCRCPTRIVHARRRGESGRARQRRSRRHAHARDVARAPRPPIDPRHLVVARRAQRGGARLRRRDAVALGRPRARSPSRLVQPAGADGPRRHELRRRRTHHAAGARRCGRAARWLVLLVRTDRVHGRTTRRSRCARGSGRARPHRDLRRARARSRRE